MKFVSVSVPVSEKKKLFIVLALILSILELMMSVFELHYYELYLDTADATTLVQQVNAESSTTAFVVAVEVSTTYSWKVVAADANGNKSNSGVYSFLTN